MNKELFEIWLNDIRNLGIKPGLSRVKKLLDLMDNPQNKLDVIHITGTNGKGSTATLLSNILLEAGYKIGQFSTPSLLGFNDMFRINNIQITDEKLFEIIEKTKVLIDEMIEQGYEHPTEYEIISAVMYQYFYEEHVDFAVVEVAMGGQNDCTNVIDYSILSIITPISFDHSSFLGDTLEKIAIEKAGIIKHNSVTITHPQNDVVMDVIVKETDEKMTVLNVIDDNVDYEIFEKFMVFSYDNLQIKSRLLGKHQMSNIICVIECILNLKNRGYIAVDKEELLAGIYETIFEGRFETISENPKWIIDGAHNLESIRALKNNLDDLKYKNLIGIVGVLKDKDLDEAFKEILPYFKKIFVTEPESFRKLEADILKKDIERIFNGSIESFKSISDVVKKVDATSKPDDIILAFGSFYMIAEVRKLKHL